MYHILKCLIVKFPVSFDFQSMIWEINQVLINLILSTVLNIHVFIDYTVFSPKNLECQIWVSLYLSFVQSHLTVFRLWPFLAQKNSVEFQMTLYKQSTKMWSQSAKTLCFLICLVVFMGQYQRTQEVHIHAWWDILIYFDCFYKQRFSKDLEKNTFALNLFTISHTF